MFLGWEGLGVSSLILISYFSSLARIRSALKTGVINRVGDLLLFLSCIIFLFGGYSLMSFVMVMCGGMVKSAQFPFFSWLPAAMAAPTPVSALVHSSTLVTAGV